MYYIILYLDSKGASDLKLKSSDTLAGAVAKAFEDKQCDITCIKFAGTAQEFYKQDYCTMITVDIVESLNKAELQSKLNLPA
jgi:hypothetical protein